MPLIIFCQIDKMKQVRRHLHCKLVSIHFRRIITFVFMWLIISISLIILICLIVSWIVYNKLVAARESIDEAISGVDILLKKRFELIPRLVNIVKGYSDFESDILRKVTDLRSSSDSDMIQKEKQDAGLNLVTRSIRVNYENYPELKSDKQFLELMKELSRVEDELAMSRRYLNGTIRDYNTKIDVFPNVIIANMFRFKERPFYEIEAFEREPQKIFE